MKRTNWAQIWANYYSHITSDQSDDETHSVLLKERDTQHKIIARAEEHLQGVALCYKQSALADPHPPGGRKKGSNSLLDGHGDTIDSEPSQNTPNSTRELSDREI